MKSKFWRGREPKLTMLFALWWVDSGCSVANCPLLLSSLVRARTWPSSKPLPLRLSETSRRSDRKLFDLTHYSSFSTHCISPVFFLQVKALHTLETSIAQTEEQEKMLKVHIRDLLRVLWVQLTRLTFGRRNLQPTWPLDYPATLRISSKPPLPKWTDSTPRSPNWLLRRRRYAALLLAVVCSDTIVWYSSQGAGDYGEQQSCQEGGRLRCPGFAGVNTRSECYHQFHQRWWHFRLRLLAVQPWRKTLLPNKPSCKQFPSVSLKLLTELTVGGGGWNRYECNFPT